MGSFNGLFPKDVSPLCLKNKINHWWSIKSIRVDLEGTVLKGRVATVGFVLTRFHAWNRPMIVLIGAFIIIYLERDVSCSEVRSADTECGGGVRCAGVTCRIRGGDLRHVTPRALQRDVLLGFQHHHSLPARIKDVHMRSPRLQGYSSFLAWHDMTWCEVLKLLGACEPIFLKALNHFERV